MASKGQIVKAISLKQPWAQMIVDGSKTIETRMWSTKYRGELLIVSSLKGDAAAFARFPDYCDLMGGAALCLVDLIDCRPMVSADEAGARCACEPGRFAWIIGYLRKVEPFGVKGQLSLYDVEMKT